MSLFPSIVMKQHKMKEYKYTHYKGNGSNNASLIDLLSLTVKKCKQVKEN